MIAPRPKDNQGNRIYKATGTIHTMKQEAFIQKTVQYRDATKAAAEVYNAKSLPTARSIASENLSKPSIKSSITEHLQAVGYNPQDSIKSLIVNQNQGVGVKVTATDSIRASELLLKLSGMVVDRHQNVNVNVDIATLSKDKLFKLKDSFDKLLNDQ